MNAGLSNLITLKKTLLAAGLQASTDFDDQIKLLGLGVANAFETYCNRKFGRVVGDTYICTADRDHAYVPRYPMEAFTSIEMKADIAAGWEMQTGLVLNANFESGLIYWGAGISYQCAQMRITYTGGFWWDITEDNTGTLPAGARALPDSLRLAWLLQCKLIWDMDDQLGESIVNDPKTANAKPNADLAKLDLSPRVKSMLEAYRRYSMI